jgi:hypothetical protein
MWSYYIKVCSARTRHTVVELQPVMYKFKKAHRCIPLMLILKVEANLEHLVPVVKNEGGIRIWGCIKATLNPYLVREREIPITRFNAENSKQLYTWSTRKGPYIVNQMPFGITRSTNFFQRIIEGMFNRLKMVAVFVDDIIVLGKNDHDHLENLQLKAMRYNI